MTMPTIGPRGGAGDSGAAPEKMTQDRALNAFGWFLLYAALVPPIALLLWKMALSFPWGE